ncbi:uncharacterized protein [Aegilops tauschii subsp. strangulata]|uniref:uncharacterized protein isoform X2 n=1 Tax=Aegilops tauschii subsp. strangulata TaxID=200361 RepID=UPI003CC8AFD7
MHEPLPSLSSRKHPLLVPSHALGFLRRRHTGACRPAQRPPDRRRHRPRSPLSPSESLPTSRRPGSSPSGSPPSPGHGGGGRRHPEARGGGLPGRPLRGVAGEAGPVLTVRHRGLGRRPRHQHGVRPHRGGPVRLPQRRSAASAGLSQSVGKCLGCCHQKLQGLFGIGFSNDQCWCLLIWRTEWAELIVKEMSSASDPNDTRNRVFRILEMFDKCAANCSTPDEAHKMREMIIATILG